MTALGRVGMADDIGAGITLLLLDDSRRVNGQWIEVSGGMLFFVIYRGQTCTPPTIPRAQISVTGQASAQMRHDTGITSGVHVLD